MPSILAGIILVRKKQNKQKSVLPKNLTCVSQDISGRRPSYCRHPPPARKHVVRLAKRLHRPKRSWIRVRVNLQQNIQTEPPPPKKNTKTKYIIIYIFFSDRWVNIKLEPPITYIYMFAVYVDIPLRFNSAVQHSIATVP